MDLNHSDPFVFDNKLLGTQAITSMHSSHNQNMVSHVILYTYVSLMRQPGYQFQVYHAQLKESIRTATSDILINCRNTTYIAASMKISSLETEIGFSGMHIHVCYH
jgi:hypothetical protein